ncbi:hypothetical protein HN51_012730, partial [Arachis hypogaea]
MDGIRVPVAPNPISMKKGTGMRAWLLLDFSGQKQVMKAGKHTIMQRTSLPGPRPPYPRPSLAQPLD